MLNKKALVCIDIGTSSFKCGSIDFNLNIIDTSWREFNIYHKDEICESDFENCFNQAFDLLKEIIHKTIAKGFFINGILICSQSQTFVPVDQNFKPLRKGIVWLDTRATKEKKYLSGKLPDFYKTAGYTKPLEILLVSKILWLKTNESDIYSRAAYFPLINEYIGYKLTGKFYTDTNNFGMTGIYNIDKKELNQEVLAIIGLSKRHFPKIAPAAKLSHLLTLDIVNKFDINYPIPVYYCGNDQSSSSIGSGVTKSGDLSVNFGTALVFYTIMKSQPLDVKPEQIAGITPIIDGFFLLNSEDQFGNVIEKFKKRNFPHLSYDEFFNLYNKIKERKELMLLTVKNGKILHRRDEDTELIAASLINYFLDRVNFHLNQIKNSVDPHIIYVSGGGAQSKVWLDILRENIKYKIISAAKKDANIIGMAKIYLKNH